MLAGLRAPRRQASHLRAVPQVLQAVQGRAHLLRAQRVSARLDVRRQNLPPEKAPPGLLILGRPI